MVLECFIQIKALADSPRRLRLRVNQAAARLQGSASPVVQAVVGDLLAYERWFSQAIVLTLTADRPTVPAPPAPRPTPPDDTAKSARSPLAADTLLPEFASRRAATVDRLEQCSAADVLRVALVEGRGPTTVADLVALAFAHETDQLARLVRPATDGPSVPATGA